MSGLWKEGLQKKLEEWCSWKIRNLKGFCSLLLRTQLLNPWGCHPGNSRDMQLAWISIFLSQVNVQVTDICKGQGRREWPWLCVVQRWLNFWVYVTPPGSPWLNICREQALAAYKRVNETANCRASKTSGLCNHVSQFLILNLFACTTWTQYCETMDCNLPGYLSMGLPCV